MMEVFMQRALIACSTLAVIAGCGSTESSNIVANQNFTATAVIDQDIDMTGLVRVRVEGINGNIEVAGAAGTETLHLGGERKVRSESVADAEAHLAVLQVEVVTTLSEVVIRTVQPQDTEGRGYEVDYQLTVPNRLASILTTINGNIGVTATQNIVSVNGTNGNVAFADIAGDVFVNIVNGNVGGRTSLILNGTINLETVNGNVNLDVPVATSADVTASVVNGGITIIGLQLQDEVSTPMSLFGRLGAGEGAIRMATVNGNILLQGF